MINQPSREELEQLPTIKEALGVRPDKRVAGMHLFTTNSQWFVVAYDAQRDRLYSYMLNSGYGRKGTPYHSMQWRQAQFADLCVARGDSQARFVRNENWSPVPVYEIPLVKHWRASSDVPLESDENCDRGIISLSSRHPLAV